MKKKLKFVSILLVIISFVILNNHIYAGEKVTIKYPAYEGADGKTRYSNAKMPSHFRISHMLKKVKSY